jgi:hypothetical protein
MRIVVASRIMRTTINLDPADPGDAAGFEWIPKDLGRPLVDLEDKEAVRAALDGPR